MSNLKIYTELKCRYLINFLFINTKNEDDYLKYNQYYLGLLKGEDYNNNYSELLSLIKPYGFSSESADYLLDKENYKDIFFEFFNIRKIDINYFHNLNSFINRVFISMNLKDINLLLSEAESYLMVFDSNIISETKKINLNLKKINLLNLLNLEFNYQISYFLYYKKDLSDFDYSFNEIKECLINNCFLIREIIKNNEFSIFNISLNSVSQTKKATFSNENKVRGRDEVINFLKKYLLQRNIIDSKNTLIDLSKKAVSETIKLYQEQHRIELERRNLNKVLERWLANSFLNFKEAKGIKVNNKVLPYIYFLKSII